MSVSVRIRALGVCVVGLLGCIGGYEQGPAFATASAPSGYGIVYAYRPKKALGAIFAIQVRCGQGRTIGVYSQGYGAFFLAPGKHTCSTLGLPEARRSVEVEVVADAPTYVRVENTTTAALITAPPAAEASAEIVDCNLVPGGRGRVAED